MGNSYLQKTGEVPTEVKIALYRITQEALNNIIKHSQATVARVTLKSQNGQVILRVIDNGKGFDISKDASGSFGLGNMNERAIQIGASIIIESKLNVGTTITVTWLEKAQEKSI